MDNKEDKEEKEFPNDEYADNSGNQNIDSERYSKYKDVFDKHKNEDGYINKADIYEILNEFGRKTTVENSNELIKSVSKSPDSTNMDFDDFVKLMESDDLEKIINKDEQPKKELTNIQIYLFMLLLLITGSINTIANKFQQNTTSLEIKYKGHQKFITFCMFNGELLCLLIYWIKEGRKKSKNVNDIELSSDSTKLKKKAKFWYFYFLLYLIY